MRQAGTAVSGGRTLASRSRPPLIGVTTSEVRRAESVTVTPEGEPPMHEMALGLTYLRALESAGALPVVMPPLHDEAIEPLLDRFDGICLSGGPDIDPEAYGAQPDPHLGPTEPDLDEFELAIARRADARGIPILAICRGAQALNVVRGGSLHQHLPDFGEKLLHRQQIPGAEPSHPVEVRRGTRLANALGAEFLDVNSFHHQAIDRLGEGLVISACAPDGTIEGVEDPSRPFLVGVQWHAEIMCTREYEASLFRSFVDASRPEPEKAGRRAGMQVA